MPVDALPAAFSVPSQVETVGALAGLAAVLGLAVLSMLYFAQARELKRLREWAGRAPERAAELQDRAMTAAAVPRRVTPQPMPGRPMPATPPGQRPAQPAPAAGAPTAAVKPGTPPAPTAPVAPGTGKPATAAAAATAAGAAAAAPDGPAVPGNGQTAAAAPTPSAAPGAPTEAKPADGAPAAADPPAPPALDDTTIGPPPTDEDTTEGEQPTTAQPASRPGVPQPLPVPPAGRAPGARPAVRTPAAQRPRAAQPLRATNPSATVPPRGTGRAPAPADGDGGNRRLRIGLVVGAIVLVLVAGIFAFTQLTGNDDSTTGTNASKTTEAPQTNTISSAAGSSTTGSGDASRPKADTTVAVLNGTTVPGLARAVADKLETAGYKIGNVTNAGDQQRAATQVAYQQGQEKVARQVARTIDVGSDAVVPIDEVTAATAGSDAVVVVTVGADQSP